jgi:protein ImuB
LERVNALGIAASIAVSSNFHAAVCLARGCSSRLDPIIIEAGEERTAAVQLPEAAWQNVLEAMGYAS